ncbi:MAG: hypothetical protein WBD36_01120 [Bacteroidota bacterium]
MIQRTLFFVSLVAFLSPSAFTQATVRKFLAPEAPRSDREALTVMQQTPTYADRKSVTLAVLYSLILPGMGEWYAGSFNNGKYSFMAEGGLWVSYAGFRMHGNWVRSDARSFAVQHSGVDLNSKDEQFEVNLGDYNTTDAYNEAQSRQRDYGARYTDPSYTWNWDSSVNRQAFRQMRIRSDKAYQNAKFVIAGLVVNRLISAFNAGRAVSAFNRTLRAEGDWRLKANPSGVMGAYGLELELSREF